MKSPSKEGRYAELLHLLEAERKWTLRAGTLNDAEVGQYRRCLSRIEQIVFQLRPDDTGK